MGRDWRHFLGIKWGSDLWRRGGPIGISYSALPVPAAPDLQREQLERWKHGMTGMPLVDANMRELAATGYMSTRGRQVVASYFSLDLKLDWRLGADHFAASLIDADAAVKTSPYPPLTPRSTASTGRTPHSSPRPRPRRARARGAT